MTVRSRTPGVPQDRENIVWRAARELWTTLGRRGQPRDVAVSIRKAIPMAAGLGGGSSDAACALRGLCALWEVAPGHPCLQRVASRIGSDVPFFLDGGVALASGRGERVRRVRAVTPFWVVLALPRWGVSTADAYRWFDADARRHRRGAGRGRLPWGWRDRMGGSLVNHLEPAVAARHPDISVGRRRASCHRRRAGRDDRQRVSRVRPFRSALGRSRRSARRPTTGMAHDHEPDRRPYDVCAHDTRRVARALTLARSSCIGYSTRLRSVLGASPCTDVRVEQGAARRWPERLRSPCSTFRNGAWPSGKARDFGSRIRRFESFRPNQPGASEACVPACLVATR